MKIVERILALLIVATVVSFALWLCWPFGDLTWSESVRATVCVYALGVLWNYPVVANLIER